MNVDTLIHARWIIPVEPENTVFEDYALAIKNDKIVALLNSDDARNKISAKEELVLENQALIPGFVNAHTHAAMSLFRGLANDLPLMNWLNNYIWPAEKKWIDSNFVYHFCFNFKFLPKKRRNRWLCRSMLHIFTI